MSRIIYCEQGSDEWFAARAGCVTSTSIEAVLVQRADSKTRDDLKWQILGEILSGKPSAKAKYGFKSKAMEDGKDNEPLARFAYEKANDCMLDQVGLVMHPTIERAACSPDSLIGDDGVLEIKCPLRETQLQYRAKNRLPPEYAKQCIWHLACTGRQYVDFVSFSPELPDHLQLFQVRLEADPAVIDDFNAKVRQFLAEVNGLLIQLNAVEKVTA
jgi:putative phage-type endonuclease